MINKEYKNLKLTRELFKKELKNKAGIYQLINMKNGKFYVGSSVNLYHRLGQHCSELNNKKQLSKGKSKICQALLKYGPENFSLVILEFINLDEYAETMEKKARIISSEQKFIDSKKPHYNINPTAGSNLGRIFSDEVKAKMSAAKKGLASH
jgi:group I intron endonuclease